jgi:hypothetical protein
MSSLPLASPHGSDQSLPQTYKIIAFVQPTRMEGNCLQDSVRKVTAIPCEFKVCTDLA